jgi:hypothetical protein
VLHGSTLVTRDLDVCAVLNADKSPGFAMRCAISTRLID